MAKTRKLRNNAAQISNVVMKLRVAESRESVHVLCRHACSMKLCRACVNSGSHTGPPCFPSRLGQSVFVFGSSADSALWAILNSSSRARRHAALPTLARRKRLPGAACVQIFASSAVWNSRFSMMRLVPSSSPISCRFGDCFA